MYLEERAKRLELENKLNIIENKLSKRYDVVTLMDRKKITDLFIIHPLEIDIPKGYHISPKYKSLWLMFMTITFDPAMFGQLIDAEKEELYILWSITQLKDELSISNVYGSFEKHKNGRTHAHLMLYCYGEDKERVKGLFGKLYSKRKQQLAVDCEVVRDIDKTKAYIDKPPYPKTWFTMGQDWRTEM